MYLLLGILKYLSLSLAIMLRQLLLRVRSAQAQDCEEIEIIVVDDASTDNSLAILEKLSSEDLRINFSVTSTIGALAQCATSR